MRYTKKNLRTVEDSAVKFGLSTSQEARFPREELGAEQTGMNLLRVKPGQREAFAHRHRTAEEIYVVISGSGGVKLGEPRRCTLVRSGRGGELVPDFWE
jgi:uncharacterized cupin superfamily protein